MEGNITTASTLCTLFGSLHLGPALESRFRVEQGGVDGRGRPANAGIRACVHPRKDHITPRRPLLRDCRPPLERFLCVLVDVPNVEPRVEPEVDVGISIPANPFKALSQPTPKRLRGQLMPRGVETSVPLLYRSGCLWWIQCYSVTHV